MTVQLPTPPATNISPITPLPPAAPLRDVREANELIRDFIKLEYDNFVQSGFHTDGLRNQIIQFYLILVGAAATAIVGLAQLQEGGQTTGAASTVSFWQFGGIAFFIGLIGIMMLPIFVRLRRVALECLAGTVLLKRYAARVIEKSDTTFPNALLWDANSLPTDESYMTASFVLIFIFMTLSSSMVGLALFLALLERLVPANSSIIPAAWWSASVGIAILTLQVVVYRVWLWHEIRKFIRSDRLKHKWHALEIDPDHQLKAPALILPLVKAIVVVGGIALLVTIQALVLMPWNELVKLLFS